MTRRFFLCASLLAAAGCADLSDIRAFTDRAPPLPVRSTTFDDTILDVAVPLPVDPFTYPGNTVDKRQVVRMVHERRYDALERFLQQQELRVARDIRYEYHLRDAYLAFHQSGAALERALDAWVAARPGTHWARLARADYYLGQAWESRGEKWASRTSEEQFEGMQRYADRAAAEVAAALEARPGHLVAYSILLEMTRLQGDTGDALRLAEEALRYNPGSFVLRVYTIQALEPRWGGSLAEIRAFAEAEAPSSARNPRNATLPGFVHAARADDYLSDREYGAAVHFYTRALESGPEWHFYLGRGEAYYYGDDYVRAVEDLTRALQQRPQWPRTLELRGRSFAYLAQAAPPQVRGTLLDRALQDLELHQAISPPDDNVVRWIDWARKARAACAGTPAPCR